MNNISYLHLKKQGRARGTGPLLDLRTDREASKARSKLVKQLEDRAAVCVWVGMCVCVCVCVCVYVFWDYQLRDSFWGLQKGSSEFNIVYGLRFLNIFERNINSLSLKSFPIV
jgi:hypothetical protein